jgi:3-oxoadipate enol-lactonase
MPVISINDNELFYQYEDFGNKNIILFSNSLGTDHTLWEPQVDILSHHFNILRYDTRGHGQSGVPAGEYSIEQLGNDVLGLLDALAIGRIVFCGISMGGLVGQWLGIHAPERLSHLIISNTAAKIGSTEGWNSRIEDVRKNGLESILSATTERWFTPSFIKNNTIGAQAILNVFKNTTVDGYTACCAAVRDADFREQLFDIEVPVLVISGLQDKVTNTDDGKYLAKRIPVARHVEVNTAHLANIEVAEEFCKLILFQTQH